jgi:hypothetical protein
MTAYQCIPEFTLLIIIMITIVIIIYGSTYCAYDVCCSREFIVSLLLSFTLFTTIGYLFIY